MKDYLKKVKALFEEKHNFSIQEDDLNRLNNIVLEGNKEELLKIETDLCVKQKLECVNHLHSAIDRYYYPGMEAGEVKTIIANVISNRSPLPSDITESVRFLLAENE